MLKINYSVDVGHPDRVIFEKDWETAQLSTKNPVNMFQRKTILNDDNETYGPADFASRVVCSTISENNATRIRSKAGTL